MKLSYVKLTESNLPKHFDCGSTLDHQKLNQFLKERALIHQKDFIGTTILAVDGTTVCGYMTLLADHIEVQNFQQKIRKYSAIKNKYNTYPSIKIGRFAVQTNYQKVGIGTYLLRLAIALAKESNQYFGARFVVVDSKKMSKGWYLKNNFKILDDEEPNFLYYDIKGWKKNE